jgi:hypothetical protein
MSEITINIYMDRKCLECRQPGATESGFCMKCVTKAISGKAMKTQQGKAFKLAIDSVFKNH